MVVNLGFPGGAVVKNPPSIPGLGKSPEDRNGNGVPVFLPGKSHVQRSLAGYSPWGHKDSDTTE